MVVAALAATFLPALVEPVKDTMSMSGWLDMASPTIWPTPGTMLNTPAGTPASSMTSARM